MLQEALNTLFQVLAFTLIPFVAFLIRKKTVKGFFNDLGLKAAPSKAILWGVISSSVILVPPILLAMIHPEILDAFHHPESMTGKFRAMGPTAPAIVILLLTAVLKTSLSEEIFFRGFVAKRLIALMGFQWGNILQAIIFGALHIVILLKISDSIQFIIMMFLLTTVAAWIMVYINEKLANGSILPGWIMHGLGNVVAYATLGFIM